MEDHTVYKKKKGQKYFNGLLKHLSNQQSFLHRAEWEGMRFHITTLTGAQFVILL